MALPPPDLPPDPSPPDATRSHPGRSRTRRPGPTRSATGRLELRRLLGPLVLVLLGVVAGGLLFNLTDRGDAATATDDLDAAIEAALAEATPSPAFSAQVYQSILPSLVYIQVERPASDNDSPDEPLRGLGSGVIINDDGDILTSLHVVDRATSISVVFADGSRASAEVSSSEPENDIAVLRANGAPEVIVPAVIGSTRLMATGDEVFAVGNPLGLAGSMSAGVISGFNRSIPVEIDANEQQTLDGLIQFDAAVNPGNSGGPLLNRNGQVIGIVTALANPADQAFFVGIGFAVPIATASNAAGGPAQ